MRKIYTVFFIILSFLTINAQTDKEAYGFYERVKKVTYYIYNDCPIDSTQLWQEDLCPINNIKTMYFDKDGNIYKSIDELFGNGTSEKFLTEYNHVHKRLKSYTRYRMGTKDILEDTKFNWSMNNRHCSFKGIGLTTFTDGSRLLNKKNREIGGSYATRTKKGKQLLKESYTNEIDSSTGVLLKTNYTNQENGDYSILYSYYGYDKKKNASEVVLRYADTKKVQRYIRKEFEYYEEEKSTK